MTEDDDNTWWSEKQFDEQELGGDAEAAWARQLAAERSGSGKPHSEAARLVSLSTSLHGALTDLEAVIDSVTDDALIAMSRSARQRRSFRWRVTMARARIEDALSTIEAAQAATGDA